VHVLVHHTPFIGVNNEGLLEVELEEILFIVGAMDLCFFSPGG
jgi:hypothetical protein